jgi:hypothetical protein
MAGHQRRFDSRLSTHPLGIAGDLIFDVARAGSEQGICFRDLLKQEVSRRGHMDVFMPCPGNRSLAPDRRLKPKDNQAVLKVAGIHS